MCLQAARRPIHKVAYALLLTAVAALSILPIRNNALVYKSLLIVLVVAGLPALRKDAGEMTPIQVP